ncbi:hypothetical protein ACIHFD_58685 [Nonomuraea sp. NPDC051941]|uniref:hypothetical protein n=1 Tax=Nonomuraea sp. NPDC051941 TaxID=3364373 RepID=UPI0037C66493
MIRTPPDLLAAADRGDKQVGLTARRRAETPQQVGPLFMDYLQAGDVEDLLSLYEPTATAQPPRGQGTSADQGRARGMATWSLT